MVELTRDQVHKRLLGAPADYRRLIDAAAASPARLGQRTSGTRWTNREMLFHLLLGYLVVVVLTPLASLISRLPRWVGRGFAAMLDFTTPFFHVVNYAGSVGGGHVLSRSMMVRAFDRSCAVLARRLDRATDATLDRWMPFPKRWDPFFTDHMSLLDIYHYPLRHYGWHYRQLTLDLPDAPAGN